MDKKEARANAHAQEIPAVLKDPSKNNRTYERGKFLGKVKMTCLN